MATLTVTIDPELLEAAKREAERRHITFDQLVADTLALVAKPGPTDEDNEALFRLINKGPKTTIGQPLTREEIYEERMWPRS